MWGENASVDQFWYQDAWDAAWDFGVGAVEGVGAMVGVHSSKGWLEMSWGDAFKEYHWDNVTAAASLAGLYDADTDSLKWSGPETIQEAWKELVHSIVPWEEWGERPGYVIGTAVLNIGVAAVGVVLSATGVGAAVGVPLLVWRGMAVLDGMGGSGRGGSGVDLPNLPDLPGYGGQGAPVVHLTRQDLEASGLSREQIFEIEAALERALVEQSIDPHTGVGPPGPGRGPKDPTVAQTLAFDDIAGHPDTRPSVTRPGAPTNATSTELIKRPRPTRLAPHPRTRATGPPMASSTDPKVAAHAFQPGQGAVAATRTQPRLRLRVFPTPRPGRRNRRSWERPLPGQRDRQRPRRSRREHERPRPHRHPRATAISGPTVTPRTRTRPLRIPPLRKSARHR